MCSWITAAKIIQDYEEKPADYFYNYVLGLPYSGGDSKLTQKALFQNLTGVGTAAETNERVVIGIDTGLKLDYIIRNKRLGLFFQGEAESYKDLDAHMRRWPKAIAVMDAGGDLIGSREFAERWKGRVFLVYFTSERKDNELWSWGEGDKFGQGTIDRERAIQLVVDEFRTKRIPLQGTESDWYEYYLDWSNLSRIKIFDPKTNQMRGVKWVRNGRDHRALATVLWRMGIDKFTDSDAEIVFPKGNTFASAGY